MYFKSRSVELILYKLQKHLNYKLRIKIKTTVTKFHLHMASFPQTYCPCRPRHNKTSGPFYPVPGTVLVCQMTKVSYSFEEAVCGIQCKDLFLAMQAR